MLVFLILSLALQAAGQFCTNTCSYATDDYCDDGGPGSEYPLCTYGRSAPTALIVDLANHDHHRLRLPRGHRCHRVRPSAATACPST